MIFETIEFYVIAAFVAAAIIAWFSRPAGKGPAREYLLAGRLEPGDASVARSIEMTVGDDGSVTLRRHSVAGVSPDGAVSLAVTVAGFDITIKERVTAGRWEPMEATDATFTLDFLGPERYHLTYENEQAGLLGATWLHVRPGIHVVKELQ